MRGSSTVTAAVLDFLAWFLLVDRRARADFCYDPVQEVSARLVLVVLVLIVSALVWMVVVPLIADPLGALDFMYRYNRTYYVK